VRLDTCYDGVDNDGDGAKNFDDIDNPNRPDHLNECDQVVAPLPTLTRADATGFVRTALARRFKGAYRHGHAKRVAGERRVARTKVTFRSASWVTGELAYGGWVTIWYTRQDGQPRWNYAYRITRTDEHCKSTGGRRCTKTYRVR
jgi:hypothetical protein